MEVVDLDRDVVQPRATPRQKRRDRRLAAERLQHLDRTAAEVNEPHAHAVRGYVDRRFGDRRQTPVAETDDRRGDLTRRRRRGRILAGSARRRARLWLR